MLGRENIARNPLSNADLTGVSKTTDDIDVDFWGAELNTSDHSGRNARLDVGEYIRILEIKKTHGGAINPFFGREQSVLGGPTL